MSITFEQFKSICPTAQDEVLEGFLEDLDQYFEDFDLTTPLRQAHFLAQAAHETGGFRVFVENLNYSAQGLRKVFPRYFPTDDDANVYARKPVSIANRVYANRMGNGSEQSGEGWKFRGRGVFQITGKSNYNVMANRLQIDCVNNPDLLLSSDNALASALVYWTENDLNKLADKDDIIAVTKKINGGTNGLDERKAYLRRAKNALGL